MNDKIFITPGMAPRDIVSTVHALKGVCLTSTGMRDAGQSDFKNRLRIRDLKTLAPYYNQMGLFSVECHGGARWHVGIMNRKENPFDEIRILRELMPNVLLQTLIRETNLWGYRPYPKNVIEYVISQIDLDVFRCFSFLNDIDNMRVVAEGVMKRGKLFQPAISFTQANWTTNEYYLKLIREIISLCGGTKEIILCIKDMAGVGSPKRIYNLIDMIKQVYPDLVIQYHRHTTDGLAVPALLAAAQSGAKILDVEEDSLVRFYGQPPILSVQAYLEESGIPVHLNRDKAEASVQKVRDWIGHYEWAESPFKGYDHMVTRHRMPGGAFPSSFEQAQNGEFLHLMPDILKMMSLYNQIVKYFDVTPGSQITWVTCSGIITKYDKEKGRTGVAHLIGLLIKFVEEKAQDFNEMDQDEKDELLSLFRNAPGDFKNLILGRYGKLPVGWPANWVYHSAFGDDWRNVLKERGEHSPLDLLAQEDLENLRQELADTIERRPTDEEFILYLMHPKDTLEYLDFVESYGEAPLVLPTDVWRNGFSKIKERVDFDLWGKPYSIELVSIGAEDNGMIHVVLSVNKKNQVYAIETPRIRSKPVRIAKGFNEVGAPVKSNIWRIGNPARGAIKEGDIVRKGEEIANLEAMKMETPIFAPYDAKIIEIAVKLNDVVQEGQLLFTLEKVLG